MSSSSQQATSNLMNKNVPLLYFASLCCTTGRYEKKAGLNHQVIKGSSPVDLVMIEIYNFCISARQRTVLRITLMPRSSIYTQLPTHQCCNSFSFKGCLVALSEDSFQVLRT